MTGDHDDDFLVVDPLLAKVLSSGSGSAVGVGVVEAKVWSVRESRRQKGLDVGMV